jgi:hypothetical protein
MDNSQKKIPLILCVDIEPEARNVDRQRRSPWLGFEFVYEFLSKKRQQLQDATGWPVHYCWLPRIDPQVAETWGSPQWVTVHYAEYFSQLIAEGDDIGLHPHCYRWSQKEETWYVDDGNQDWINECIQMAYDGYERVFARQCETFRMGDGFMNTATMREIECGGARFELTPEPGSTPSRAELFLERHTGVMPDCSDIPRHPYHPSVSDWRKPDATRSDGITIIPMSAGFVPQEWYPQSRLAPLKRAVKSLLSLQEPQQYPQSLNFSCPQRFICYILNDIITNGSNPLLSCALRTNTPKPEWLANVEGIFNYLIKHPRRQEVVFSTPKEAMLHWQTNNATSA